MLALANKMKRKRSGQKKEEEKEENNQDEEEKEGRATVAPHALTDPKPGRESVDHLMARSQVDSTALSVLTSRSSL